MTEQTRPETYDSPMLDIGGDIGALIVYTEPGLDDAEIEISPTADPSARTHNQVHPRRAPAGITYSAVYPTVPEGDYILWRDATTAETTVAIRGGYVTEYHWRGPRPARHTPHHRH